MKPLLIIISILVISSVSYAELKGRMTVDTATNQQAVSILKDNEQFGSDICAEVQKMYESDTLKNVQIGDPNENYQNSFFVDFDNDGKDEELQYFMGKRMHLGTIVNGKRSGFPVGLYQVTVGILSQSIIKMNGKFFVLYVTGQGPYELHQVIELSEEQFQKRVKDPKVKPPIYDTEHICKMTKIYIQENDDDNTGNNYIWKFQ